jgi:uncharacterized glyoxalase superfamily protein PhnB
MPTMPTPPDWPRLSTSLFYRDAAAAIDWLCRGFGFEVRLKIEGDEGRIIHSELTYGDALIMVCEEGIDEGGQVWRTTMRSPGSLNGANTQSIMLYVDDADAHCELARAAGAEIIDEPKLHDYGEQYWADRSYGVRDPEGHIWWISQRLRTG